MLFDPTAPIHYQRGNQMNHTEYPKRIKKHTVAQLHYVIKDCREALEAYPETDNASYYLDEILYCSQEIKNRQSH